MEKIGKTFCLNCAERKQALSIILNSPLHLSVTLRIFIANLWEKIPFVQHKIINNSNDQFNRFLKIVYFELGCLVQMSFKAKFYVAD